MFVKFESRLSGMFNRYFVFENMEKVKEAVERKLEGQEIKIASTSETGVFDVIANDKLVGHIIEEKFDTDIK